MLQLEMTAWMRALYQLAMRRLQIPEGVGLGQPESKTTQLTAALVLEMTPVPAGLVPLQPYSSRWFRRPALPPPGQFFKYPFCRIQPSGWGSKSTTTGPLLRPRPRIDSAIGRYIPHRPLATLCYLSAETYTRLLTSLERAVIPEKLQNTLRFGFDEIKIQQMEQLKGNLKNDPFDAQKEE
jgi:hypothetical protein